MGFSASKYIIPLCIRDHLNVVLLYPMPTLMSKICTTTEGHKYVRGQCHSLKPCWHLWAMLVPGSISLSVACAASWVSADVPICAAAQGHVRSVFLLKLGLCWCLWSILILKDTCMSVGCDTAWIKDDICGPWWHIHLSGLHCHIRP